MSEEEIIEIVNEIKNHQIAVFEPKENLQITRNYFTEKQRQALQGLLDLYNKEKEKNNSLIDSLTRRIEYTNELEAIKLRLTIENNKLQNSIQDYVSKDKIREILYEDYGETIYDYNCAYKELFEKIEELLGDE